MMKAEKLMGVTNEMKDFITKEAFATEDILEMDPRTLRLIQLSNKFIEASNEYMLEVESIITSVDKKMDELLKIAKGE